MATSEAKKASNAKWDAKNMAYQTVKVPKTLLADFKAACASRGNRVNTVLREAMENYVTDAAIEKSDSSGTPSESPQEAAGQSTGAGVVSLSFETLEAAQKAAEAAGEVTEEFISRAVETQAKRDEVIRKMGGTYGNQ